MRIIISPAKKMKVDNDTLACNDDYKKQCMLNRYK